MITLVIIGTVLYWLIIAWAIFKLGDEKKNGKALMMFFIGLIGIVCLSLGENLKGEKDAYENALNGNNPYKKEYIYKQIDSTYVIVDSVYVKKEEK